jgi:hypothetical protein
VIGSKADWARVAIRPGEIIGRALDLAVPSGATEAQQAALDPLLAYGEKIGVAVRNMVIP